jgi:hypothetical protein
VNTKATSAEAPMILSISSSPLDAPASITRFPVPSLTPKALPKVAKRPTGYTANLDAEEILTLRQIKGRSGIGHKAVCSNRPRLG